MKRMLCLSVLALGVAATPLVAQNRNVEIRRIAPESTFIVAGVRDFARVYERWQESGFEQVMKATYPEEMFDEIETGMTEMLDELDLSLEDLAHPQGNAGLAIYSVNDPDTGMPLTRLLGFADFGENADQMNEVIQKLLRKADEEGEPEYEEMEVAGRTVYAITVPEVEDAAADEMMRDDPWGQPQPGAEDIFGDLEKVYILRDTNLFWFFTDLPTLQETLEMVDAEASSPFADRPDMSGAMSLLPGEQDAYGAVLMSGVFNMLSQMSPQAGMAQGFLPMVIGDVSAISAGMRFGEGDVMAESSTGIYMPNGKSGLTAHLDRTDVRAEVPDFIGPDTLMYVNLNVDLSGVLTWAVGLARQFLPMAFGPEATEMVAQFESQARPIVRPLGDEIHLGIEKSSGEKGPGIAGFTAIAVEDAQAFETAISNVAAQVGMEPRDFLGNRIYSLDPSMMMGPGMAPGMEQPEPVAIGIGGGYVLMGNDPAVQQGLRAIQAEDPATLQENESFEYAMQVLPQGPAVAWGYIESVEFMKAQNQAQMKQVEAMRGQIDEMREIDPAWADEMEQDLNEQLEVLRSMDYSELEDILGPNVWTVSSVEDGFVYHSWQLKSRAEVEE